jgi:beta-lactamase superfamily II metal-dependent hydrolase
MNAEFYLFNVDHGQSAAMHLPNGRWCIFDLGRTADFSPVNWIAERAGAYRAAALLYPSMQSQFRIFKATVSHLHHDHLADYGNLFLFGPEYMRTVMFDQGYLADSLESSSEESRPSVVNFAQRFSSGFSGSVQADYGNVQIREFSLTVAAARPIGGSANSRVNNASLITRIDVYGNSILICGDIEKESWDTIFGNPILSSTWRSMIENVDILVAPHHGHASGYSVDLLNMAKPAVVLVSVVSGDPNVDTRYSQSPVRGIRIDQTDYSSITTRKQGHIKVSIQPPVNLASKGLRTWTFGDDIIN